MIIALCLIIIAVAMQNFEIPQLTCSINFLCHAIEELSISLLENVLSAFLCVKKRACSMCIYLTAAIDNCPSRKCQAVTG